MDDPVELHVLTLNVRTSEADDGPNGWTFRRPHVAAHVLASRPDVATFQEVSAEQFEHLQNDLARYGLLWDEESHLAIAWRLDRLVPVETATVALPSPRYPRKAFMVSFDLDAREWLTVVAVHSEGGPLEVAGSAEAISKLVAQTRSPHVVAGDFNTIPYRSTEFPSGWEALTSRAYDVLTASLTDGFRRLKPWALEYSGNGFIEPAPEVTAIDARIDWILASPSFRWLSVEIVRARTPEGRPISDHWPQHARLEYPR